MKNKKVFYILIGVVIFIIGLAIGIIVGLNIGLKIQKIESKNMFQNSTANNEGKTTTLNNSDNYETTGAESLQDNLSEDEYAKLKTTVEQDEAGYTSYQKLEGYEYTIKREPDRIYFKSSKADVFYCFEKTDENYSHLLEVVEDRMFYSVIEDYNLYCFTPDSIDTMMTSGDNYIIFDYDNGDIDFQKDIIFRFAENTRLFRLATYLSYSKEFITRENLGKSEFATDTTISGYKYMSYIEGD